MANTDPVNRQLTQLEKAIEAAARVAADLRATQEFALGTADVSTDGVSMVTKVEALLRVAPMSLPELAVELGAAPGRVTKALGALKRKGQVWNVGEQDRPRWRWVIGDECSFPELVQEVQRLITERPMTHSDLKDATGANPNRLKGAITQLARNGVKVRNVSGDSRRAIWYVRSES